MRESRASVTAKLVAKVRRDGLVALLRDGPTWLVNTALTAAHLAALRRLRRARYRQEGVVAVPDPTGILEVDPQVVTHLVPPSRFEGSSPRSLLGTIRGGDWDRDLPRVEDQPKYRACRARVWGATWEATGIVDRLATDLARSDAASIEHGCESRAALRERYETERTALLRSLRRSGYDRTESPVCCRVHVGRDGALLFGSGGRHRFYLNRLLGEASVPVQVLCRHADWQAVRDAVATGDSSSEIPDGALAHVGHPDLRALSDLRSPTAGSPE